MIAAWSAKVTDHCFRDHNAYWVVPTISGFRDRKNPMDSKGVYRFAGYWTGLWTVIISGYTCYYYWQVFSKG